MRAQSARRDATDGNIPRATSAARAAPPCTRVPHAALIRPPRSPREARAFDERPNERPLVTRLHPCNEVRA